MSMKKFINYFRGNKQTSANIAKERLKIIVAHQRVEQTSTDFLPQLRQELVTVIAKYVKIDLDQVKVELERDENHTVLELNITIPETAEA